MTSFSSRYPQKYVKHFRKIKVPLFSTKFLFFGNYSSKKGCSWLKQTKILPYLLIPIKLVFTVTFHALFLLLSAANDLKITKSAIRKSASKCLGALHTLENHNWEFFVTRLIILSRNLLCLYFITLFKALKPFWA